jgi:organic radical activating enzyme
MGLKNKILLSAKTWLGTIKPVKDFYLRHIKQYDGYIRIYPTLRCNLKCEYCTNECHKSNGEDKMSEYRHVAFGEWANALKRINRPVVVTGGEPSIYPGIIELLNELSNKKINIKFYTNLFWSTEFLNKWVNEMNNQNLELFVSYHPQVPSQKFLERLFFLKERGKFSGIVHTVLTKENADAVESAKNLFTSRGIMLMIDDNYDYKYPEACMQKARQRVFCKKKNILIAPDGNRYQCVSKMIRMKEPLENIFNENCTKLDPQIDSICNDYGYCANCDVVYGTKIKKYPHPTYNCTS